MSTTVARPSADADLAELTRPRTVSELLHERVTFTDRIDQLERDLRSLRVRNRALINARHDLAPAMAVVGTFAKGQSVERILGAANTCELLGAVPAIRFVRNLALEIIGIELAILADGAPPVDDCFRGLVSLGGMAVCDR